MKRCLKFGVGRYEKIREKFPKITSCNFLFPNLSERCIFQLDLSLKKWTHD